MSYSSTVSLGSRFFPLMLLAAAGCGDAPRETGRVASTTQQMRAGVDEAGDALVGVDVLVTDEAGLGVPCGEGNVEVDIEVSRNGMAGPWVLVDRTSVENACSERAGGDLALVFDNSASVVEQLEPLKDAVARASDRILSDGGRVSLVRASTEAKVLSAIADDRANLGAAIEAMWISNGWSALWDGVRMGNETFATDLPVEAAPRFSDADAFCSSNRKRGILLFTDGRENNSAHQKLRSDEYPGDGIDTTFDDLVELKVGPESTPIYTVGLGDEVDAEAMQGLADHTGGRYIQLDSLDDLEPVLTSVSDYFAASRRFCTEIPSHLCGDLDVRVTHRWTDGTTVTEGVQEQHVVVPCEARTRSRVATILLTLTETSASDDVIDRLVANTVNWVSPVNAPHVLFLLDDAHHGEFSDDPAQLFLRFTMAGYVATYMDEPKHGVRLEDIQGYDVVWFSNPGHPMDDAQTFHALRQFAEAGGGVVLQGDDMSASLGHSFSLSPMGKLEHVDNGVTYCGKKTDNGHGDRYEVTFGPGPHPILDGLEGISFTYPDDIDTTRVADERAAVLATATVPSTRESKKQCAPKPVVVAYTPEAE